MCPVLPPFVSSLSLSLSLVMPAQSDSDVSSSEMSDDALHKLVSRLVEVGEAEGRGQVGCNTAGGMACTNLEGMTCTNWCSSVTVTVGRPVV